MTDTTHDTARPSDATVVKVDIWSDIACPFCYVGKRKFEAGLAASGVPVEIEYHSYVLSPDAPEESSETHAEHIVAKLGVTPAQAQQMEIQMTQTAAEVGITVDYPRLQPARTFHAHELLHHAKAHGLQREMKERLMAAYFSEGRHVGRVDQLADLAAEVGLDRDEVLRVLGTGEHLPAVHADIDQARSLGISGVPFFVIDGKYGVSGAQSPETFASALAQAAAEHTSAEQGGAS